MSLGQSATPLGKVEGLGSAHHGGGHWLSERLSSAALLLLGAWLIASLLFLPSLDQPTLAEWLRAPSGAVPMTLFVIAAFRHALDGIKVVVDDYVHDVATVSPSTRCCCSWPSGLHLSPCSRWAKSPSDTRLERL